MDATVERLLQCDEPVIRYKVLRNILHLPPDSPELLGAQDQIRDSATVRQLLAEQAENGRIPLHAYQKWGGAFWVLHVLADLGYPPGDERLIPLREQALEWLFPHPGAAFPFRDRPVIAGKRRNCSLQEANGLYAMLALGLADERIHLLARALIEWQWPDGGWNCDQNPRAVHSSYHESLTPLRALNLYAGTTGDAAAQAAARRAGEIFLKRGLFRRLSNGQIIHEDFVKLHYPAYWHYEILSALKVMVECGWIDDPRCQEALDLLESRRLPDGGFPADAAYYRVRRPGSLNQASGTSLVNWGGKKAGASNPWVTVEALGVLSATGRL